jgi:cation:H+ antiporter
MPMTLARSTLLIDLPLVILATLLLVLLSSDIFFDGAASNVVSRIDGILLLLFAIVFFIYNIRGKVIETPDIDEPIHILSSRRAVFYIFG